MLERLSVKYPSEADWFFYLAELYHRRVALDQAESVYQQVLEINPDFAPALLRLGMVAEARTQGTGANQIAQKNVMLERYSAYYKQRPSDWLGIKKLAGMALFQAAGFLRDGKRDLSDIFSIYNEGRILTNQTRSFTHQMLWFL